MSINRRSRKSPEAGVIRKSSNKPCHNHYPGYIPILFLAPNTGKTGSINKFKTTCTNYLGGICRDLECKPVQIGGHKNHVYMLCLLSRKIAQMKLVQEVKQGSSKWIKTMGSQYADFYWQEGYGIFSVSPNEVEKLIDYIKHQHVHHQQRSFKEEFRLWLKKYKVDYDEQYVWD